MTNSICYFLPSHLIAPPTTQICPQVDALSSDCSRLRANRDEHEKSRATAQAAAADASTQATALRAQVDTLQKQLQSAERDARRVSKDAAAVEGDVAAIVSFVSASLSLRLDEALSALPAADRVPQPPESAQAPKLDPNSLSPTPASAPLRTLCGSLSSYAERLTPLLRVADAVQAAREAQAGADSKLAGLQKERDSLQRQLKSLQGAVSEAQAQAESAVTARSELKKQAEAQAKRLRGFRRAIEAMLADASGRAASLTARAQDSKTAHAAFAALTSPLKLPRPTSSADPLDDAAGDTMGMGGVPGVGLDLSASFSSLVGLGFDLPGDSGGSSGSGSGSGSASALAAAQTAALANSISKTEATLSGLLEALDLTTSGDSQLAPLREKLKDTEARLAHHTLGAEQERASLAAQLAQAKEEARRLAASHSSSLRDHAALEKEAARLRAREGAWVAQHAQLENERDRATAGSAELQQSLQKIESAGSELRSQLRAARAEGEAAKEAAAAQRKANSQAQGAIAALETQLERMRAEQQRLSSEHNSLRTINARLEADIEAKISTSTSRSDAATEDDGGSGTPRNVHFQLEKVRLLSAPRLSFLCSTLLHSAPPCSAHSFVRE
jgi:chromosome segregation ATPase